MPNKVMERGADPAQAEGVRHGSVAPSRSSRRRVRAIVAACVAVVALGGGLTVVARDGDGADRERATTRPAPVAELPIDEQRLIEQLSWLP